MQDKYFKAAKTDRFISENIERYFIEIVKHADIERLKKFPDFKELTRKALAKISSQEIFDQIAVFCIKPNKIAALQFLIEDCNLKYLVTLSNAKKRTLFIVISETLRVDSTTLKRFQIALKKGLCRRRLDTKNISKR